MSHVAKLRQHLEGRFQNLSKAELDLLAVLRQGGYDPKMREAASKLKLKGLMAWEAGRPRLTPAGNAALDADAKPDKLPEPPDL